MYNRIAVMGRIATPLELKTSQNGIPYVRFRVAANRRFHSKDNETVDFFNVTAWRNNAEFICKYFSKGNMIMIDGEMQTTQYEDRNGNPATWYDIVVDRVCFTGEPKNEGGYNNNSNNNNGNRNRGYSTRRYSRNKGSSQNSYGNNGCNGQQYINDTLNDDYPF